MSSGELWTILLAGGDGERLESLTRLPSGTLVPKQFCSLVGPTSLLRLALARSLRIAPAGRVMAVVSARHRHWWRSDLPELPSGNILVQPVNRGTAPAILLAAREIWRRDHDATALVVPSDHFVDQEWTLAVSLAAACERARARPKKLILLGARPRGFEPGYGWIVPDGRRRRKRAVAEFVEKPEEGLGLRLLDRNALVNTLLCAARVATLVELFDEQAPALAEHFRHFASLRTGKLAPLFRDLPIVDFSHQILERATKRLEFLEAPACGWSDLGTPERVAAYLEQPTPPAKVFAGTPAAPLQLASVFRRRTAAVAV